MRRFRQRSRRRFLMEKLFLHCTLFYLAGFIFAFSTSITERITSQVQQPLDLKLANNATLDLKLANNATEPDIKEETKQAKVLERTPEDLRLLIIVTIVQQDDVLEPASLTRLAQTLRQVKPPLLWILVQDIYRAWKTSQVLRMSRVMYRELFYWNEEDEHKSIEFQRNLALKYIANHRIKGVVHFASASNVYTDVKFFEEVRETRGFSTWPMATVSANASKVMIEGPLCDSSEATGWFSKEFTKEANTSNALSGVDIHAFSFRSEIMWSNERFKLPNSSSVDENQDFFMHVQDELAESTPDVQVIPSGCSFIMLWHLKIKI